MAACSPLLRFCVPPARPYFHVYGKVIVPFLSKLNKRIPSQHVAVVEAGRASPATQARRTQSLGCECLSISFLALQVVCFQGSRLRHSIHHCHDKTVDACTRTCTCTCTTTRTRRAAEGAHAAQHARFTNARSQPTLVVPIRMLHKLVPQLRAPGAAASAGRGASQGRSQARSSAALRVAACGARAWARWRCCGGGV